MFGLGLGALLRNQAAAMVFGIVYFFILDSLLNFVPWVRKGYAYTPGGAIKAFNSNGARRGHARRRAPAGPGGRRPAVPGLVAGAAGDRWPDQPEPRHQLSRSLTLPVGL